MARGRLASEARMGRRPEALVWLGVEMNVLLGAAPVDVGENRKLFATWVERSWTCRGPGMSEACRLSHAGVHEPAWTGQASA